MVDENLKRSFARDVVLLKVVGIDPGGHLQNGYARHFGGLSGQERV